MNTNLQKMHTRQLLDLRDSLNAKISAATDSSGLVRLPDYYPLTLRKVKAELATRPHIPNKQEAKVIRQQKAKVQKSR